MAFNPTTFQNDLATSLKVAPPTAPTFDLNKSLSGNLPITPDTTTSVTTPKVAQPGDTGILGLINPLKPTAPIRPAFNLAGTERSLPFGGPVLGFAVDAASRTLEAIPSIALTTLANYRTILGGGAPKTVQTPFDISRIGLSQTPGSTTVQDTGTRLFKTFSDLQDANPHETGMNIAKAVLAVPVQDALNAFVAGGLTEDAAHAVLRATAYDPEVSTALQQLGIAPKDVSPSAIKTAFVSKANRLFAEGNFAELDNLGRATNTVVHALHGGEIPALNRFGQMLQDTARLGLQDASKGFKLERPIASEISPEKPVIGLPGTRPVPGTEPAFNFGLSIQKTERVGGEFQPRPDGEPNPDALPPAAAKDWEDNFQEKHAELGRNISYLEAQGRDAGAAGKRLIAKQIEPLVGQQAKLENDFIAKWGPKDSQDTTSLPTQPALNLQQPAAVSTQQESNQLPSTPEEAAKTYYDSVLAPAAAKGEATIISGDKIKEYYGGDYSNDTLYSKAAFQNYERALTENPNPVVRLMGGGPGIGKTEYLMPQLTDNFNGIVYESTLGRYDGAVNAIKAAQAAGKKVEIYGVVGDLGRARVNTITREQRTGRPVTDEAFASLHAGFPKAVAKLVQQGLVNIEDVHLVDLRNKNAPVVVDNPLALLASLGYDEGTILKKYAKRNYTTPIRTSTARGDANRPSKPAPTLPTPRGSEGGTGQGDVGRGASDVLPKAPVAEPPAGISSEDQSYQVLADQHQAEYALYRSPREEERLVDNLTAIFADMKGIEVEDLAKHFTDDELENAKAHYEYATDALNDHPGRALMKYVSRESGDLPEVSGGKGKFSQSGDVIFQELVGQEASGGGDLDKAQEMVDQYKAMRKSVGEIQGSLRHIRKTIRLQKLRKTFVESSRRMIATEVAKDVKALRNLVMAAERAGFARGTQKSTALLEETMKKLKSRRSQIIYIQKKYNLTDKQMADARGNKDPRFMEQETFDSYLKELDAKASAQNDKNVLRFSIDEQIERKDIKNPENLRVALELPPLSKMSYQQMQEYDNALSLYQRGDSFLGPRMIQTVGNTDLGDVKTVREIREALAKQAGVDFKELEDVRGGYYDRFTYDAALAQKNPLYKYMVTEFIAKDVENAQILLALRRKMDTLAKAARKSRKLGIFDRLVPQDKIVFDWLETPAEEKDLYARDRGMTPAEREYAEFVQALYRNWRDILIEKGALKKWRSNYITHTTRGFFERWKDDGLVNAVWTSLKSMGDVHVDFDAVGDTGEVLGLEKFFKYSLPRAGVIKPSQNVAAVVMSYAHTFYKKQALDAIIPKLDAYTFSLQRPPKEGVPTDPTGKGVDGKLRKFVRQWLNNKKGRRIETNIISQGSQLDSALRAMKLFISLKYLGINIVSQVANTGGALHANFSGLTTKAFFTGAGRVLSPQGRTLMKKYPGVIGNPPFEQLISAANDLGDTLTSGLFIIMQELMHEAKAQFFLGSLTAEEYMTGVVSTARQAEIKINMGRFHPLEGMESLVGASTEGKSATLFKTWAVPYLFTAGRNMTEIIKLLKTEGAGKAAASRQARELFKIFLGAIGVYIFWNEVFGTNPNDSSFVSNLKKRLSQDLASGISAIDPQTWGSFPMLSFFNQFGMAIRNLVLLQAYTTSGSGYQKGDLKGVKQLETLLTPGFVKQFTAAGAPLDLITNSKSTGTSKKSSGKTLNLVHP